MPWRLIGFIILLVLIVVFVGFNIENVATVSLVFKVFTDVPVFIIIFISLAIGMVVMLPFTFRRRGSKESQIPREPRPLRQSRQFRKGKKSTGTEVSPETTGENL